MLVPFGSMPEIAVTLHSKAILESLGHEIDRFACHVVLCANLVLSSEEFQSDINFKPAVVGIRLLANPTGRALRFALQAV